MTSLPTYFIGHGGVPVLYVNTPDIKVYRNQLRELGKEILALNAKGLIVTSGHFESEEEDVVDVNIKNEPGLIYDFNPASRKTNPQIWEYKYPHHGSAEIGHEILDTLKASGIKSRGVERGTDHGVWVPFKLMFPEDSAPLNIPVVSVSTLKTDDFKANLKLGEALSSLRSKGYVLIHLGMIVHNLYIYGQSARFPGLALGEPNFEQIFTDDILSIIKGSDVTRKQQALNLASNPLFNISHPTLDHFTPFLVFIGSSKNDEPAIQYDNPAAVNGMSYASYRLGTASA